MAAISAATPCGLSGPSAKDARSTPHRRGSGIVVRPVGTAVARKAQQGGTIATPVTEAPLDPTLGAGGTLEVEVVARQPKTATVPDRSKHVAANLASVQRQHTIGFSQPAGRKTLLILHGDLIHVLAACQPTAVTNLRCWPERFECYALDLLASGSSQATLPAQGRAAATVRALLLRSLAPRCPTSSPSLDRIQRGGPCTCGNSIGVWWPCGLASA